jgi:hypothetical protein
VPDFAELKAKMAATASGAYAVYRKIIEEPAADLPPPSQGEQT